MQHCFWLRHNGIEAECAELQLRVRHEEQRWVGEGLKVTLRRPDACRGFRVSSPKMQAPHFNEEAESTQQLSQKGVTPSLFQLELHFRCRSI